MDILTIVLACSLHFDDELVTALIHKVSNENPLLVGDLVTLTTHDHLATVDDAKAVVDDIIKHGGRPAVGLLGIPTTWAARFGRTPADLFDSCTNVAVGTAALSEYALQCAPHRQRRRARREARTLSARALERERACILRRLGDDLGATGYSEAVLAEIAARRARPAGEAADPPTATSPIDAQPDDLRRATPSLLSSSSAAPEPLAAPSAPTTSTRGQLSSPLPTAARGHQR